MRKKIQLQTDSEVNSVTNLWIQHLVQRIIFEQLDVPPRLQPKLLHQINHNERKKER
ncbi:hypothetical protein P5663_19185 [Priestia flexa]|uniref:hypothetical protein n=1 Tax=Priestia flexa TaxID=86664 RepID=UPI002202F0EC|nr:hypothetical protein [Priestia flexa]USY55874.1 hypothetical protein NIZ91_04250 [Bacillus sp. 1780r2a1]WEZ08120.1 hypothetical protein P5663_19185 [Priestia flexa]